MNMRYNYLRWSENNYAGERYPPDNPVTPLAGSWPLFFLKKDKEGRFLDPYYRKLRIPIKHPNSIDFEKELIIVQKTLENLSPDHELIGEFYGTGAPTKQWTPVIDKLIDTYGVSPVYAARILAVVQAAINDTMVVVWDLKYDWDVARPDQYDETMETLLCTPRFPAYPSGHASMSGCAEVILSYYFPKEAKKLHQFAEEDAISRLYAGVHFPSDNNEGLKLGREIGKIIVNYLKTQHDSEGDPVDRPFWEFQNADILPSDYQQLLPFDFPNDCTSLIRNVNVKNDKNAFAPKPYLAKMLKQKDDCHRR